MEITDHMRMFVMGLLLLTVSAIAGSPSPVQGKWSSEREVGDADGKTYKHVSIITLKESEGVLTGTLVATSEAPWMRSTSGKPFEIQDGKAEGEKFSFKIVYESDKGVRTAVYEGNVTGDQMKGIVKFRGIGQTWDLDAKRIE